MKHNAHTIRTPKHGLLLMLFNTSTRKTSVHTSMKRKVRNCHDDA